MSTLVLAPPLQADRVGGEPTLDDVLVGVWEGLSAGRAVACPVCEGEMRPLLDSPSAFAGGRCGRCGTALT